MKKHFFALTFILGGAASLLLAEDGQNPARPQDRPPHQGGGLHLLPRNAEEALNLSSEQRQQIEALETETRAKLEKILTPEQQEKLKSMRPPHGNRPERQGEGPQGDHPKQGGNNRPALEEGAPAPAKPANPAASAQPLPPGVQRVAVVFTGGHETVPVDHGRPVALIAAALGVKDEVFREAFSHVHPAGPGSNGPTDAEARTNKAALMNALGKYGITDQRINAVSNFYRYAAWEGGIWKNRAAEANALVKDGSVVGYEVINGGFGYTTPPTVLVPGVNGASGTVALTFSQEMEANGAVASIAVGAH